MVHLPALPGSPLYDAEGGMELVRERTAADLLALQEAGFDGVMFCNENDRPYTFEAGLETVSAMSAVIGELRHDITVPFGVDILWDPRAALAVAKATGARWVREIFTGAYGSDFGLWNTSPGETLRYRRNIGATDVRILTNISAEFARAARRPADRRRRARGRADLARGRALRLRPDDRRVGRQQRAAGRLRRAGGHGRVREHRRERGRRSRTCCDRRWRRRRHEPQGRRHHVERGRRGTGPALHGRRARGACRGRAPAGVGADRA